MFHRMEVNEKSHHSINFVQFHKSLHTAVRNMSLTRTEFEHCVERDLPKKDIYRVYGKLANGPKPTWPIIFLRCSRRNVASKSADAQDLKTFSY